MLPVYLSWDRMVDQDQELVAYAEEGVMLVLSYLSVRAVVKRYGTSWTSGDWGSVDWYLDQASMGNGQTDSQEVLRLHHEEPWQKQCPHLDFVLTGRDLNARLNGNFINFVFGVKSQRVSVQSIFRFKDQISNREMLKGCVWLLAAHEFGHLMDLTPLGQPNSDRRGGMYEKHCTNLCVMRQVMSVQESMQLVLQLREIGADFCAACRAHLATVR